MCNQNLLDCNTRQERNIEWKEMKKAVLRGHLRGWIFFHSEGGRGFLSQSSLLQKHNPEIQKTEKQGVF